MNRDEYVEKLKAQIDQWNAEMARWEEKARGASAAAQEEYQRQLAQYQARREEAMAELKRMQAASADAFGEMMRGTDAAMKSMQEAFRKAAESFQKK